jgi:heat shock protein HtpX
VTATIERVPRTTRPLQLAAVVPVVSAGIIVTAIGLLALGLLGLLLGLALTIVAAVLRVRSLTAGVEADVLHRIGAVAVTGPLEARLVNLAEGLAAQRGIPVPTLRLVDDPGANMLVVGMSPERSALVVTSGLLEALERIQLEAIIGRGVAEIRQGDLPAGTMAVRSVGRPAAALDAGGPRAALARPFAGLVAAGVAYVADPDRDLLLDQAGVSLTRFPPGLIAALERCAAVGTTLRRSDPAIDHLWMAPTGATGRAVADRPDLDLRIEALRLL